VVSGHGEVRATPDRATILFAVETRAERAADAAQDNARRTRATLDSLKSLGLTSDQLSTIGYTVSAVQSYDQKTGPKVVGYAAQNAVRVELRKLDQVGRAIDKALAGGANRVSSLDFTSSAADSLRRVALAMAVANARADAETVARAAGGTLGPLIELTASPGPGRPQPMMFARIAAGGAAAETPVNPGELSTSADVSVRWAFKAAERP
jgi:uncharacterized protein YggE